MTYCTNPRICPDGNCMGCKNGAPWCTDPRCYPYCRGCETPPVNKSYGIIILSVIILLLLILLGFVVLLTFNSPHESTDNSLYEETPVEYWQE